jgi:hypothetical protein
LADEKECHIVEGEIATDAISKFFSQKGDGMLPGDIVWDFIKKQEENLNTRKDMSSPRVQKGFNVKIANTMRIRKNAS